MYRRRVVQLNQYFTYNVYKQKSSIFYFIIKKENVIENLFLNKDFIYKSITII